MFDSNVHVFIIECVYQIVISNVQGRTIKAGRNRRNLSNVAAQSINPMRAAVILGRVCPNDRYNYSFIFRRISKTFHRQIRGEENQVREKE